MRIDDTDPDEMDDLDRRVSARVVLGVLAAVVLIGAAVVVVLMVRGGGDDATGGTTSTVAVPETVVDDGPQVVGQPNVAPDGFPDYGSDYMGAKLELLFQRVTDAGVRVTLRNNGDWNNFAEGIQAPVPTIAGQAGWAPAAWCSPIGGFRLAMSYKDAIGIANGSRYSEVRDGGMNVSLFSSGYAENVPFRVLVLQIADDVTQVTAKWADGAGDTAAPVNGVVVLASPGISGTKFDIVMQTAAAEKTVLFADLPREGDLAWQHACNPPPPELPPAGEQPLDAVAAEQEIRSSFDMLWDSDVAFADKGGQLLDDPTGVQVAIDTVFEGGLAAVAKAAIHSMNDLVFTSPTEAWFEYDISTTSGSFTGRFGIAYLLDGHWRFARAVICQDLALAGGQCEPYVDQIYPPGSAGGVVPLPVPFPTD